MTSSKKNGNRNNGNDKPQRRSPRNHEGSSDASQADNRTGKDGADKRMPGSSQAGAASTPAGSGGGSSAASRAAQPSRIRQTALVDEMRSVLRSRGRMVFNLNDLNDILEDNDWDVAAAVDEWEALRREVLTQQNRTQIAALPSQPPSGSSLPAASADRTGVLSIQSRQPARTTRQLHSAVNDNPEQERREAAVILREVVQAEHGIILSRSQAILLLHLAGWDIEVAFRRFEDAEEANERLSERFDHMRVDQTSQADRDERLAILTSITQRSDWYSILTYLEKHNWDLVAAVLGWFSSGIPVTKAKKDKVGGANEGFGRRKDNRGLFVPAPPQKSTEPGDHDDDDRNWAQDDDEFVEDGSTNVPTRPKPKGKRKALGFAIDDDRSTVRPGGEKWAKTHVEHFANGHYWHNSFKKNTFKWLPDNDPAMDDEERKKRRFDWSNQADLDVLNNWRRQIYERITAEDLRPASQPMTPEMNEFLYELHQKRLNQLLKKNPSKSKDDLLPFAVPKDVKESWARQFNKKFAKTTPPGYKEPVRERKSAALMTASRRHKKLADDFKIGQARSKRTARQATEEDDQPPRKKRKGDGDDDGDGDGADNGGDDGDD